MSATVDRRASSDSARWLVSAMVFTLVAVGFGLVHSPSSVTPWAVWSDPGRRRLPTVPVAIGSRPSLPPLRDRQDRQPDDRLGVVTGLLATAFVMLVIGLTVAGSVLTGRYARLAGSTLVVFALPAVGDGSNESSIDLRPGALRRADDCRRFRSPTARHYLDTLRALLATGGVRPVRSSVCAPARHPMTTPTTLGLWIQRQAAHG
jgi:hypothetical protein